MVHFNNIYFYRKCFWYISNIFFKNFITSWHFVWNMEKKRHLCVEHRARRGRRGEGRGRSGRWTCDQGARPWRRRGAEDWFKENPDPKHHHHQQIDPGKPLLSHLQTQNVLHQSIPCLQFSRKFYISRFFQLYFSPFSSIFNWFKFLFWRKFFLCLVPGWLFMKSFTKDGMEDSPAICLVPFWKLYFSDPTRCISQMFSYVFLWFWLFTKSLTKDGGQSGNRRKFLSGMLIHLPQYIWNAYTDGI